VITNSTLNNIYSRIIIRNDPKSFRFPQTTPNRKASLAALPAIEELLACHQTLMDALIFLCSWQNT
jgi:hypothetical protein